MFEEWVTDAEAGRFAPTLNPDAGYEISADSAHVVRYSASGRHPADIPAYCRILKEGSPLLVKAGAYIRSNKQTASRLRSS